MSGCTIDHSLEDVRQKLAEQSSFLPEQIVRDLTQYLNESLDQERLNEVFHLLKKYDLATPEERQERDQKIKQLLSETT